MATVESTKSQDNAQDQNQSASSYFTAMFEQVAELAKNKDHTQALKVVRERNQLLAEQKKKIEEQEAYLKFQTVEADSISSRNKQVTQVALRLFWRIDENESGLVKVCCAANALMYMSVEMRVPLHRNQRSSDIFENQGHAMWTSGIFFLGTTRPRSRSLNSCHVSLAVSSHSAGLFGPHQPVAGDVLSILAVQPSEGKGSEALRFTHRKRCPQFLPNLFHAQLAQPGWPLQAGRPAA